MLWAVSGHDQAAAGSQHPQSFGQGESRGMQMAQDAQHEHSVEGGVGEGQGVGVGAGRQVNQVAPSPVTPPFQLTQQAALSPTDVEYTGVRSRLSGVQQGRKRPALSEEA